MKNRLERVVIATFFLIIVFGLPLLAKSPNGNKLQMRYKQNKAGLFIEAAEYEWLRMRDPQTNEVPNDIRQRELRFASELPTKEDAINKRENKFNKADIVTQNWNSEGPTNVVGRILAVEIDFESDSIILAGSASGGLWKTTNLGATWDKKSSLNACQSVTCIAQNIAYNKRNIWYYGTGELLSTTSSRISIEPRTFSLGDGIYRSIDSGETWEQIPTTIVNDKNGLSEFFQGVWSIVVDTTNAESETILAACYGGIMRTSNGGESWEMVLGDSINKPFSTYVIRTCKNEYYAAISSWTINGLRPLQTGIFRSTNGIDWANITPPKFPDTTRIIKLAVSPLNNKVIYVVTEAPIKWKDPMYAYTASKHTFWRYSYNELTGKGTWLERSKNLPGGGIGDLKSAIKDSLHGAFCSGGGYALALAVHPFEENTVFLGGINLYRNYSGFSDSNYTNWMGGYPYDDSHSNLHPDIHCIKFLKSNINTMLVATDGGIYLLQNCLLPLHNWEFISYGLLSTQFYWVGIDNQGNGDRYIAGGIQGNGVYCLNKGKFSNEWDFVAGGDGMTTIVANNKEYILSSFCYGDIISYRMVNNLPDSVYHITPSFLTEDKFAFFTNFALDLNDNKTLYLAAKNSIWRNNDIKSLAYDSTLVENGWVEMTNARLPAEEYITAISISKNPPNRLYFGTVKGRVFRVDNANVGNPNVFEITGNQFPANGFISCIDVDTKDANKIFVVFSNYNIKSIFYSSNGGSTWSHQGGNLEENPDGSGSGPSIRWIRSLKASDGMIYFAGTSVGLFSTVSLEGDNTLWVREGSNSIGYAIVDMIIARETDGYVVIATQGSGVFSTNVKSVVSVKDIISLDEKIITKIFPNPADDYSIINILLNRPQKISIFLYDNIGQEVANFYEGYVFELEKNLVFNTKHLPSGQYFLIIKNEYDITKILINIIH